MSSPDKATAPYPAFDGTQACAGADPEIFFPSSARQVHYSTERLKEICGSCIFRRPCLAYALTHQVHGVWGGTHRAERDQLRKEYGITAEPVVLPDTKELELELARIEQGGGLFRLRAVRNDRPGPTNDPTTPSPKEGATC